MKRLILVWGLIMTMNASAQTNLPDFDAQWDYNNPAETEAKFREILPAAEASGDTDYLAELLTQIARTQGLQRKFEEAHATLNQVEEMLGATGPRVRVRYLLERGRTLNSSGHPDEAKPLFLEAWERGQAGGFDFLAVDAAHMVAIVVPTEEQMDWNLKAAALAEQSEDPKAQNWLGSLYNNMGWTYFDMKEYQQALTIFEKALAFREKQGDPENIRIAKWCIAKMYRMLDKPDKALEMQQALLKEREAAGAEDDGYVFEEIAECYEAMGRHADARPWFARAYANLSQDPWLQENEAERLERLKRLGETE